MSITLKYIIEREKYFNSIGEYFCQKEDKCSKQCEACNKYIKIAMKRTREQLDSRNQYERDRRAKMRLTNPLPPRLTKEELHERQLARQRKINALNKTQRLIDRANGIKPVTQSLTPEQREAKRLYAKAYRDARKKPKKAKRVKVVMVPKSKPAPKPVFSKAPKISKPKPVKQTIQKPIKPKIMQKAMRQSPPSTSSTYHKPDHFKQPAKVKIKNTDEGKIRFRIDSRTEVMIFPDQDRDEVRARYLNR